MIDFLSVIVLAVALAMDAFSVSITKGFTQRSLSYVQIFDYGLFFGFFQFLMPVIGYFVGSSISVFISDFAPVVAFVCLVFIGFNMIKESVAGGDGSSSDMFSYREVFILAIATSIDALAVGLSFALLSVEIFMPSIIIGVITFILSIVGVFIGSSLEDKFGKSLGDRFEIIGGVVLILIGLKILFGF